MSNIPEARKILGRVARDLRYGTLLGSEAAAQIECALDRMTRPKPAQRGRLRLKHINDETRENIKIALQAYPEASMIDIAELVGLPKTYGGRVSEISRGLRPTHRFENA